MKKTTKPKWDQDGALARWHTLPWWRRWFWDKHPWEEFSS